MTAYANALIVPTATSSEPASASKTRLWSGRILSGIALAFLAFDTLVHLLAPAPAVDASNALGFSPSVIVPLGIIELVCWVLAVIPRSAVLGTLLWTGYLGGAVATHDRRAPALRVKRLLDRLVRQVTTHLQDDIPGQQPGFFMPGRVGGVYKFTCWLVFKWGAGTPATLECSEEQ